MNSYEKIVPVIEVLGGIKAQVFKINFVYTVSSNHPRLHETQFQNKTKTTVTKNWIKHTKHFYFAHKYILINL